MPLGMQTRAATRPSGAPIIGPRLASLLAVVGPGLAMLAVYTVIAVVMDRAPFSNPGIYLYGIVLGLLNALVALGMALIYRANRILNFAQGELGLVPTVLAVDLVVYSSLPYLAALALGIAGAVLVGGLVEFLIVRRFVRSPRLILTVATIGLAQLLTVGSLAVPLLWSQSPLSQQASDPLGITFEVAPIIFNGSHLLALIIAPMALVAVAVFLRKAHSGVAIRAAAERSDRTALLGVPVKRLNTMVWAIAAVLSFTGMFLRAGIAGLPFSGADGFASISFLTILSALTALALGKFTNLPAVAFSAVCLGVLQQQLIFSSGNENLVYPVMGAIIFIALGLRRVSRSRAENDAVASWQTADEIRPIPRELRLVPEVAVAKWGGLAALVFLLWRLPTLPFMDQSAMLKSAAVVIFAIVGISIIVLTGWAGQVSLGQMGFVAVGAAVGAVATKQWGLDLSVALFIAGGAGAVAAVIVGLPALRIRGLFLAVTTLAFATTAAYYLLNPRYQPWIPVTGIERTPLFGRFALDDYTSMYYVCLVVLGLVLLAVSGLRRSRVGRTLLALRENERAAQSYGINVTRTKLLGFALSGFFAAVAGCLYVHLTRTYTITSYAAGESFNVFTSTVVGGLGGPAGAILGAVFSRGGTWFLTGNWQYLPSAIGVLFVLLILPGGISGLLYQLRDMWLRSVARRNGIVVPSLLADVGDFDQDVVIEHAEEAVEDHDPDAVTTDGSPPGSAPSSGPAPAPADERPSSVGTGGAP